MASSCFFGQIVTFRGTHLHRIFSQVQQCVDDLLEHIDRIEANIAEYDRILSRMVKTDHRSQRLIELKGIGPTTSCALVASIGNAHDFRNGRQLAV